MPLHPSSDQPPTTPSGPAWTLVATSAIHSGHLDLIERSFLDPNGSPRAFEITDQGPVACVLAMTSSFEVVLVRQFRPGPNRFLTELPAGFVDAGEEPLEAAVRELAEETGFSGSMEQVGVLHANAYATERRHVFVCTDARRTEEPHPDPGEDIEVITVSLAELRTLLRAGEMTVTDACYLALDFLGLLSPERWPEPQANGTS
jgi:ADP-ribose pyrophosphatase